MQSLSAVTNFSYTFCRMYVYFNVFMPCLSSKPFFSMRMIYVTGMLTALTAAWQIGKWLAKFINSYYITLGFFKVAF